ncbi:MAG: polysaccharide deacetylase family protein [Calditrichaceae bacterium]|nr:polysaccharide deacetylase family protein [Calditrichaceae bacterium]MBN2710126.1 polysaccharide deacetylase family protein [Calditrichaceae bacterium]RQV93427.1 MAG: chitooligosaccharide deacetylase [Calditrichota bacterium]
MNRLLILFFIIIPVIGLNAQEKEKMVWNNHQCAVALTYDDGLNVHLDKVIPVLDSLEFRGTFYLPGNSAALDKRLDEWRAAANRGHELGNHTLFHPCAGKSMGREWVPPDYDLDDYTIGRMVDEIRMANLLLKAVDGKTRRTFAYTCGENAIGDSVFTGLIRDDFVGARGVFPRLENIASVDIFDIGSFMIQDKTGEDLIKLVTQAKETGRLLVFLFHGVGGEHNINIDLEEHNKLLFYLKENERDIWIAPLAEIAEYIRNHEIPAQQ